MFNYLKVRKNVENLNSWITQMSNKPSARKKEPKIWVGYILPSFLALPAFRKDVG